MRIIFGTLACLMIVFFGWIAWHQVPLYFASQDAYDEAQTRIKAVIEDGQKNVLNFSDLDALRVLPPEIGQVAQLKRLTLSNTNIVDLTSLSGLQNLEYLSLNQMPLTDLTPISRISSLKNLSLHGSWIHDLSPLSELSNLEDLNLSYTAVRSLEPLVKLRHMEQLTLHSAYADDGSQSHFNSLEKSVFRLNSGKAFKQNYQPGFRYKSKIAFERLVEQWTLGGPPPLK